MADDDLQGRLTRLWHAGNRKRVEALCLATLQQDPQVVVAHRWLGRLYLEGGESARGLQHYEQALTLRPGDPDTLCGLGQASLQLGEAESAAQFLLEALALDPNHSEAHHQLGLAAERLGQLDDAIACHHNALHLDPNQAESHIALAGLLLTRDPAEAEAHLRQALALCPQRDDLALQLADQLEQQGRLLEAAALLQQRPKGAGVALQATALAALGGDEKAAERLRQQVERTLPLGRLGVDASALQPAGAGLQRIVRAYRAVAGDSPAALWCRYLLADTPPPEDKLALLSALTAARPLAVAWCELGALHFQAGRWEAARSAYAAALALDEGDPSSLNGYAAVLLVGSANSQVEEAIPYLERAVARAPRHPDALNSLGFAYFRIGDQRALATLQRAVAAAPTDAEAHNNLALALLATGELGAGWEQYEWRLRSRLHRPRPFPWPQWSGEPLAAKGILVHGEQGVGDEILFASCLPDLLQQAPHCAVECDPRLLPLLARSLPTAQLLPRLGYNQPPPLPTGFTPDYQLPSGSLARHFRPDLAHFPSHSGYLQADPSRVSHWRQRLAELGPGPKIGFSWRSGQQGFGRPTYAPLAAWQPLLSQPGCHFISLQYDDDGSTAATLGGADRLHRFTDLDLRHHLDELAALMTALDLILTVNNLNAPLAGALGRPIWRLGSGQGGDAMRLGAAHYPWFPSLLPLNAPPAAITQLLASWLDGTLPDTAITPTHCAWLTLDPRAHPAHLTEIRQTLQGLYTSCPQARGLAQFPARQLLTADHYPEAQQLLEMEEAMGHATPASQLLLAGCQARTGDLPAAAARVATAYAAQATLQDGYAQIGQALAAAGEWSAARQWLERDRAAARLSAAGQRQLAALELRDGDLAAATASVAAIYASGAAESDLGFTLATELALEDSAIATLTDIDRQHQRLTPWGKLVVAKHYLWADRSAEAEQLVAEAYAADPTAIDGYGRLAIIAQLRGQPELARRYGGRDHQLGRESAATAARLALLALPRWQAGAGPIYLYRAPRDPEFAAIAPLLPQLQRAAGGEGVIEAPASATDTIRRTLPGWRRSPHSAFGSDGPPPLASHWQRLSYGELLAHFNRAEAT